MALILTRNPYSSGSSNSNTPTTTISNDLDVPMSSSNATQHQNQPSSSELMTNIFGNLTSSLGISSSSLSSSSNKIVEISTDLLNRLYSNSNLTTVKSENEIFAIKHKSYS